MTENQILAGAMFYARASAHRAIHGVIPKLDKKADETYWLKTVASEDCLNMVRSIIAACEAGDDRL